MTNVLFETGVRLWNDRGGDKTVGKYFVEVPSGYAKSRDFKLTIGRMVDAGIKQVVPNYEDESGIDYFYWLEANTTRIVATPIKGTTHEIAEIILKDLVNNEDFLSMWANPDPSKLDVSALSAEPPKDTHVYQKIKPGMRVLIRRGRDNILECTYGGTNETLYDDIPDGTVFGPEDMFLPAGTFDVNDYKDKIEVYPSYTADAKRGNKWYARSKRNKNIDILARTKVSAVEQIAFQLALAEYHAH